MRVKSRQQVTVEGEQGQLGTRMRLHGLVEWVHGAGRGGTCHRDGPPGSREPAGLCMVDSSLLRGVTGWE